MREPMADPARLAVMRLGHGFDLSVLEEGFLSRTIDKRRLFTGDATPSTYAERLTHDRAEADALLQSLRVSFSEFFRNPLTFALLETTILPSLADRAVSSGRNEIRVWSAGCAAGQEAGSVAILLDELLAARNGSPSFRIFATDLAEAELAAARRGVYDGAAVRNVRLRHLDACFTRAGESYVLAARLRDRVDFSLHDLLDAGTTCPPASIYGDFDLVLCSNVLIYYRPETQRSNLDKLRRCLSPSGYLVTDEAERAIVENAGGFRAVAPPAAVFQTSGRRKSP